MEAVKVRPDTVAKSVMESSNLDFMRCYAVMLVLLDHVLETAGAAFGRNFHPFDWYCGRMGVLLFFVHTSLVLMFSLQRSGLSGINLFRNFYIRRAFRIYPLSIFCVLFVWLAGIPSEPWSESLPNWTPKTLAANLLLVQNLADSPAIPCPLWSLPLELQMYLVLPILFLLVMNYDTWKMPALLLAGAVLAGLIQPHITVRASVVQFVPCFLGGVFAFMISLKPIRQFIPWHLFPVSIFLVSAAYLGIEFLDPTAHHPAWLGWMMCLLTGIGIPFFRNMPEGALASACKIIARYSYGIYLFHVVALWFGFGLFEAYPVAVRWGVFLAACTAAPVAMYHAIEKPMMQLGARLAVKYSI